MKFKILPADLRKSEDRTVLLHLQKKCLPNDKPAEIDRGHWWIVYTTEGKPVAFAGMWRSAQWFNAGYMCRAGVLPAYQGHGLQKQLIKKRIAKAKTLNWEWLITDTTDNPASANSLISMGFKLYEPLRPWAYKHSLYWRKQVLDRSTVKSGAKQKAKA